ncbi:MAG: UvrD-helicase domain-containing protein, partial [Akkermansiaceae bacterium]|nr:UvrD-helicase domain-containing protein [Akkermansiaceae bacterium]
MNLLSKNLMILASAGSGKTYQLSNRVIGLVSAGVDPRSVVALTFTRKAAGEFADDILMKLAKAARVEERASVLRSDTGIANADYEQCLQEVVRALPEIMLGTLDSFFSRMVRGFQHELGVTGGQFELIEGPVYDAAVDDILGAILRDALGGEKGQEFLHAFRRATAGREERGVCESLRNFVG